MRAVKIAAILLMCATLSWAGETGGSRSGGGVTGSSGHGTKHSAKHVSSVRDIARLTYPEIATEQAGGSKDARELRPTKVLLTMPRSFDREGVYVWRDSVGVWNIRCVSTNQITLTGEVVASEGILVVDPKEDALKVSKSGKILINLSSEPSDTPQMLQFKAEGNYVDFRLFIDGKNDHNLVYIGSGGFRPQFVPFRLENRPVVTPKARVRSDTYPTEPLPQFRVHEQVTPPSSDASSHASGGGSVGGAGGHKRKK